MHFTLKGTASAEWGLPFSDFQSVEGLVDGLHFSPSSFEVQLQHGALTHFVTYLPKDVIWLLLLNNKVMTTMRVIQKGRNTVLKLARAL